MNVRKQRTSFIKPDILSKLKELNHEKIGMIADRLDYKTPAIVRKNINDNAPVLQKKFWQEIIKELTGHEDINTSHA